MSEPIVLTVGGALILIGVFGLIEAAIQLRRRPVSRNTVLPQEADAALALVTEIEESHVELTVIRDRETNPDGQPRQEIIRTLEVGDPVVLVPEPADAGEHEIRVVAGGGTIGYLPPNRVAALVEMLAAAVSARSEISYVGAVDDVFSAWVTVAVRS
jgi:hypothetical protein